MIMSAANFVMQKNYPNSEILLNRDTLWMCRNSLREDNYESFFIMTKRKTRILQ
jgi:hypothetical protein